MILEKIKMKNTTPITIQQIMKQYNYSYLECQKMPLELLKFLQESCTKRYRNY